jgi:phosphopantothenoylcysteine synthetase/decarboxylase
LHSLEDNSGVQEGLETLKRLFLIEKEEGRLSAKAMEFVPGTTTSSLSDAYTQGGAGHGKDEDNNEEEDDDEDKDEEEDKDKDQDEDKKVLRMCGKRRGGRGWGI